MKTKYYRLDKPYTDDRPLYYAAKILKAGGLVAFPTETVYGLGADARKAEAVEKIFLAKGRPSDNPLIVHLAGARYLPGIVAEIPAAARKLMDKFWPGPLTLVLPRGELTAPQVSAGLDTVAVRVPSHPVALRLLELSGIPVAAPSANLSGKPSPTNGRHVLRDLAGGIEMVLDAGSCQVGVESTVLDVTSSPAVLLRPGGVTLEQLQDTIGEVALDSILSAEETFFDPMLKPRAPGMKYTHYAPEAEVTILKGSMKGMAKGLPKLVKARQHSGKRIGVLCSKQLAEKVEWLNPPDFMEILGDRGRPQQIARHLFAALRDCDRRALDEVLVESFEKSGIGMALMNRLNKAAAFRSLQF